MSHKEIAHLLAVAPESVGNLLRYQPRVKAPKVRP
jgi:hypothetical protein